MSQSELRNDDDIEAILKIAVSQAGGIEAQTLRERLMVSAAELGLTPDQVAAAEEKWAREEKERRDLAEFQAIRKKAFWGHLASYVVLNGFLVAVNLVTDRTVNWAGYCMLALGIPLVLRALGTFFPNGERFQRRYRRWRKQRDTGLPTDDHERGA